MRPILRLAWLDFVRVAWSWRAALLFVLLLPALWFIMTLPEWYPDPSGGLVASRAFIGDAVPYVWASYDRVLAFYVLPAVILLGSLVGDDRATGGPMTSATRVGGRRQWWWAKAISIAGLGAAYTAVFAVALIAAALLRGWELETGPSPYAAVELNQRILAVLPDRGSIGSSLILLPAAWLQLIPVLLVPAVVGLVTRNRVLAYAAGVALVLTAVFIRNNSHENALINPIRQLDALQHDPFQVSPEALVTWTESATVTAAWLVGLLMLGAVVARRVEL